VGQQKTKETLFIALKDEDEKKQSSKTPLDPSLFIPKIEYKETNNSCWIAEESTMIEVKKLFIFFPYVKFIPT
jgi:hypothetical protein